MSAELRPRVKHITPLPKAEVLQRIKSKVEDPNTPCSGWAKEGFALICAPENSRHIWTPQLNLQIDETEDGTEIRGVIGPSAAVWTAFAFAFSLLGFIAFVSLFWGLSQISLDHSGNILWLVPIAILLIAGVFLLAKIGQKLSKNEVVHLKEFISEVLDK